MSPLPNDASSELATNVSVTIRDRGMAACLFIPADCPRGALTVDLLCEELRRAEVAVTKAVLTAVKWLLPRIPDEGEDFECVISRGLAANHGDDGHVEWLVESKRDEAVDEEAAVDHYERGSLLLVRSGDVLAKVVEPTSGVDGFDVCGKPLAARDGQPAQIEHDESVARKSDTLVAQMGGMLHREQHKVYVSEAMELTGGVNFETGNIDFKGDVVIRGNVLDRFMVKATGDVDVHGVIEAAHIKTGGKLLVQRGVTGFPDGTLTIGGDLIARFLNRATGDIQGDLKVDREVIDCDLTVAGDLDLSRAMLTGGELRLGRRAVVANLGRPNGVQTKLRIAAGSPFDMTVTRHIHPGVQFISGKTSHTFYETVKGPIRIRTDSDDTALYSIADGPFRPLASLQGVRV